MAMSVYEFVNVRYQHLLYMQTCCFCIWYTTTKADFDYLYYMLALLDSCILLSVVQACRCVVAASFLTCHRMASRQCHQLSLCSVADNKISNKLLHSMRRSWAFDLACSTYEVQMLRLSLHAVIDGREEYAIASLFCS